MNQIKSLMVKHIRLPILVALSTAPRQIVFGYLHVFYNRNDPLASVVGL